MKNINLKMATSMDEISSVNIVNLTAPSKQALLQRTYQLKLTWLSHNVNHMLIIVTMMMKVTGL